MKGVLCSSSRTRGNFGHQTGFLLKTFLLLLVFLLQHSSTILLVLGFQPTTKRIQIKLRSCNPAPNRICNALSATYSSRAGRFNYDDDSDKEDTSSSFSRDDKTTTRTKPLSSTGRNPLPSPSTTTTKGATTATRIGRAYRRFWARIQQHLYRMFGRDRWIRMQRFLRSITERYTIYVLECCEGKYYVGSTQNKKKRFYQHLEGGGGSVWTQRYRPKRVMKAYNRIPKKYALGLESKVTAETMLKYGVNNARGAMFCNLADYTVRDLDSLTRFLGHYNDLSYRDVRTMLRNQLSPSKTSSTANPNTMMQVVNNTNNSTSSSLQQQQQSTRGSKSSTVSSSALEETTAAVAGLPSNTASTVSWNVNEFDMTARQQKQLNGFHQRGRISNNNKQQRNDRCWNCGRRGHWAKDCPF